MFFSIMKRKNNILDFETKILFFFDFETKISLSMFLAYILNYTKQLQQKTNKHNTM